MQKLQASAARTRRSFRASQIAALLYCATIPFDAFTVIAGRTLPSIVGMLFLFTWFVDLVNRSEPFRFPKLLLASAIALLSWSTATMLWSPPGAGLIGIAALSYSVMLVALLVDTMRGHLRSVLLAYVGGACILGIWIIVAPTERHFGRLSVGGADENETSLQFAIGIAAIVWLYISARVRPIFLLGPGLLMGLGIILAGSRTGFVAMVLIIFAGLAYGIISRHRAPARVILLIAAGFIGFALAEAFNVIPNRVHELITGDTSLKESGRAQIEALYLRTVSEWWFTGVGYGSDAVYLNATEGYMLNAHGLFFKGWVEQGGVGLVLIVALLLPAVLTSHMNGDALGYMILITPVLIFASLWLDWASQDFGSSLRSQGSPTTTRALRKGCLMRRAFRAPLLEQLHGLSADEGRGRRGSALMSQSLRMRRRAVPVLHAEGLL